MGEGEASKWISGCLEMLGDAWRCFGDSSEAVDWSLSSNIEIHVSFLKILWDSLGFFGILWDSRGFSGDSLRFFRAFDHFLAVRYEKFISDSSKFFQILPDSRRFSEILGDSRRFSEAMNQFHSEMLWKILWDAPEITRR